ncbi:VC0807 family protein [Tenuibacillus multivorans]|uniref:Intracellular septation protein A n=1 Tax=Tenuibacillus multivorans TaxID=237069 RepID=A0A1H0B1N2_9BACI|nr:VC0807 family protein [Tenuibacillus multivorans]GEL77567.1 hypothetical protein TMU01_18020 [Tenuibacillus multivorans]SDN39564.1 hypothetical protein SAMN05216498_2180 [Tenuibacillus multivorans]
MKNFVLLDLIFYVGIPLLIWNYGRDPLGDYYAMLLSTVPGIIYTIYRFIKQKQFNIAGLFIIGSLIVSTTVNVMSNGAENMLWNQVYLGYATAGLFLLSIILLRPLALYFAVDFAYLQGHPRGNSKALFNAKGLFKWFQLLTGLFVFRGIFQNSLKAWLIMQYGVDGYDKMLIYLQVTGWVFTGLIIISYIFISSKITQYLKENDYQIPAS